MHRQDYEKIAALLAKCVPEEEGLHYAFAEILKADNPAFNERLFLDACVEQEEAEPPLCGACNGTGEGQHDGTRCMVCNGRGTEREESDADI